MKTYKLLFIITILIAGFGCEEDFLEKKQPAAISLDAFYVDADDAEKSIIACYAPLQLPYYVSPLMLVDMMGEDAVKGSTYGDNSLDWNEMIEFQGLTSAMVVDWKWDIVFEVIFKSNLVINNVPSIEMDEVRKNQIIGEAHFLRAYMYFEAAVTWGNVPIITDALEDYYITNNTTEEVWLQVESDLAAAIDLLPEKSEWAPSQIGRATKGAAQSLLGKSYLYQEKFADAQTQLAEVIKSGEYSLHSDFSYAWSLEGENSEGSIFEIQFAELGNDAVTEAEGNFISKFQGPRDITGWGFNQGTFVLLDEFGHYSIDTESLNKITNYGLDGVDFANLASKIGALSGNTYLTNNALNTALTTVLSNKEIEDHGYIIGRSAFKPTDPRFVHTFIFLDETIEGLYIDPNIATDHYTGIYNKKAFLADMPTIWRLAAPNERIIRLSDVYLMYAEAAAHNNNIDEAKLYLNKVRQRANNNSTLTLADFPNYTSGSGYQYQNTQEDLLIAIANERRTELAFEHHRFWDLVRTGKAEEVLSERGYEEGVHNLWPIPQKDIDRSGGILKQNPGY